MTFSPHTRRNRIVELLRSTGFSSVGTLAEQLQVSEVTIRTDLGMLERTGVVTRTHGGAVLAQSAGSNAFQSRIEQNGALKQQIARAASALIEDGDSVVFDASTTTYAMADFLSERRDLTIFTNGIELAQRLAEDTSHRVILTGGLFRRNTNSLGAQFGAKMLADVHVRLAFVSCTGWSSALEPMDDDMFEVEIKTAMCDAADRVIILADSTKFDRKGIAAFTTLEKIDRVFTDQGISSALRERLPESGVGLVVCNEDGVEHVAAGTRRRYRIGFANQDDSAPFSTLVRQGLTQAAAAHNIDLLLADNHEDGPTALANAEYFIQQRVDLVIEFNTDVRYNNIIMDRLRAAQIPVIAIDIPMPGATFFGVDNYRYGLMAGRLLGQYVAREWQQRVDTVVSLDLPASGPTPAARMQGQLDGLRESVAVPESAVVRLDSKNSYRDSYRAVAQLLPTLQHMQHIPIIGINDETVLGALAACAEANMLERIVTVGLGADQESIRELKQPNSRMIGAIASFPERYGEAVIAMAVQLLRGQVVPPSVYTNHLYVLSESTLQWFDLEQLQGNFVSASEYHQLQLGQVVQHAHPVTSRLTP